MYRQDVALQHGDDSSRAALMDAHTRLLHRFCFAREFVQRLETRKAKESNPKCEIDITVHDYKPNTPHVRFPHRSLNSFLRTRTLLYLHVLALPRCIWPGTKPSRAC